MQIQKNDRALVYASAESIDRETGTYASHYRLTCKPPKIQIYEKENHIRTVKRPWNGLAYSVHDFGVAGGLRRPYVHPRLPDKDKTAHSSRRSRQTGKMLVVLRDGRKLFGVLRSYDQFGTHDYIHVPHPLFFLCSREDVNVFFFLFFCLFPFWRLRSHTFTPVYS